jgi:hypothetical protein
MSERIHHHIRELRAAGKHDEAERVSARLHKALRDKSAQPGKPMAPGAPRLEMKLRNLRQAAGLLDAAGYREHAEKARSEAGRIESEMRRAEELRKREAEQRKTEETKRREADAKGAAENKHREEDKRRSDEFRTMRDEMNKLRREVEELRGLLRKANGNAAGREQPERDAER